MTIVKKFPGESDTSLIFRFKKMVRKEKILEEFRARMFFQTEAEKKLTKLRRRLEEEKEGY